MGGGAELVELSLRIPPWEPMRALSREELRRTGLDLGGEAVEPRIAAALTPVAALAPEPAAQRSDRGWTLVEDSGAPTVLARRHPLTYEGERIGSFDLVLACGEQPGSYAMTYAERRTAPAGMTSPPAVDQVRLWVGDSEIAFRVHGSAVKGRNRQVETVATATISATLVRAFAGTRGRSLSVLTRSGAEQPPTMIRIGNSGLAKGFPQFEAECGERSRPRLDAHAHLDPRVR
jgi:hypothetical protein